MATALNPYLSFDGTARAAMEFYRSVFGGDLTVSTFGDYGAPDGVDPAGIMHAQLETSSGFTLMGSDLPPGASPQTGNTFSVSLSGDDAEALRGYWDKLSDGATVTMPMERQMWGDDFGMLTDQFGTPWLVNIQGSAEASPAEAAQS